MSDYLEDLGRLALGSRMKRLSDYFLHNVRNIYRARGVDLEPSHMPMLLLLFNQGPMTLNDIAKALGTSHPLISQRAKTLVKMEILKSETDSRDERNKVLSFTDEGYRSVKYLKPARDAILKTIIDDFGEDAQILVDAISRIEARLEEKPYERSVNDTLKRMVKSDLKIIDYEDAYKEDFRLLNSEWLAKHFKVEEIDEYYFADPKKNILDKKGRIFFAKLNDTAVGTCALIKTEEGYELAKMGVAPEMRGFGIGRKLVEHSIDVARGMKLGRIFLLSASPLKPAIALYESCGFEHVKVTKADQKKYGRADVKMELKL